MKNRNILLFLLLTSVFLAACSNTQNHSAINTQRLAECPATPNCVNSQQQGFHAIKPLIMKNPGKENWAKIVKTVSELPRTTVINSTENYVKAEVNTLIFRFTDDLELLLAKDNKTVHIRSASRLGYSDMGTNGRRVEHLRKLLKDKALIE